MTARNETAFTAKHVVVPTTSISTPPRAGPRILAVLNMALLSPMALARESSETISATNAWRVGLSTVVMAPCTMARA